MAQIDPGLASILSQISGPSQGIAPAQQGMTLSQLQQMLAGTARQSLTTTPFSGAMPHWVPPSVRSYVSAGVVDPYLGTGDQSEWRVFMGAGKAKPQHSETRVIQRVDGIGPVVAKHVKTGGHGPRDKTMTMQQAMNEPYLWDETEVSSAIQKFQAAGVKTVTDFDSLSKAWGSLVQRAGAMYSLSSGQRKVTPWDVLDLYKNEQEKAGTLTALGPGDPGFNGSTTQVSRSVSDISEGDAWSSLQSTLSQMLGRDPSDHELRDFTYRMNSLAAHNPSITKTISKYKNGQIDSTSSHTSEGFGAGDVAEQAYQHAQAAPDYAEYQAGTTYFNALMSALGPIGG